MDATTRAVRAMYEQYPYPAVSEPGLRLGSNARLLLSYGRMTRPARRPIHVLDAGCGRANGTLGGAALQPDVQFVGIDINRVTLADGSDLVCNGVSGRWESPAARAQRRAGWDAAPLALPN